MALAMAFKISCLFQSSQGSLPIDGKGPNPGSQLKSFFWGGGYVQSAARRGIQFTLFLARNFCSHSCQVGMACSLFLPPLSFPCLMCWQFLPTVKNFFSTCVRFCSFLKGWRLVHVDLVSVEIVVLEHSPHCYQIWIQTVKIY